MHELPHANFSMILNCPNLFVVCTPYIRKPCHHTMRIQQTIQRQNKIQIILAKKEVSLFERRQQPWRRVFVFYCYSICMKLYVRTFRWYRNSVKIYLYFVLFWLDCCLLLQFSGSALNIDSRYMLVCLSWFERMYTSVFIWSSMTFVFALTFSHVIKFIYMHAYIYIENV